MASNAKQRILILDFGSQYTQLLARRIRDAGVYCEILPWDVDEHILLRFKPAGIVLSGGPESVAENKCFAPEIIFKLGCPILGVCYGMQLLAAQLGGKVQSSKKREYGYAQAEVVHPSRLLDGLKEGIAKGTGYLDVWMSHGDHVETLPFGFVTVAKTKDCPIVAMADESRAYYGLQFHPEVSHTLEGEKILKHFLHLICGLSKNWTTANIAANLIKKIHLKIGEKDHVLLALSGGVDSSVLAALLHQAIGARLICIFVDTGLLRLNEAEEVHQLFSKHLKIKLIVVNAANIFLQALQGVVDPEEKRKIIGRLFIEVFEREAKKLNTSANQLWLAQGTIYPDVIESAQNSKASHAIKSHHNVGGLPETMQLPLLEPLRELFKDEVRALGLTLGLPKVFVLRHPFPGPGLAVRIMGEILPERLNRLRLADAILIEMLKIHDFYEKVAQAFVVYLPVKSVGVIGDARQYHDVLAIRIVESVDFMTAHVTDIPVSFITKVANRIVNEVPQISRVVYDVTGKPPATIEWE